MCVLVGSGRTCRCPAFSSVSCRYSAFLSCGDRAHDRYPVFAWWVRYVDASGEPVTATLGKVAQHAESNSGATLDTAEQPGSLVGKRPLTGHKSGRSYGKRPNRAQLGKKCASKT